MDPSDEAARPNAVPDSGTREKPICVALILCNEIVEDKRSNNKTLVGLFSAIVAPQLPAVHPRMYLMASLTSGTGAWAFTFRILAPSGQEVLRVQDTVRFVDPLAVHDLIVDVHNLPLPEPGVYFVDLLLNGIPISNRRFTVHTEAPTPPAADLPQPPL